MFENKKKYEWRPTVDKVHNDDAPKNFRDKCMRLQIILSVHQKPQPMNLIEWIKFNENYHNYVNFSGFFLFFQPASEKTLISKSFFWMLVNKTQRLLLISNENAIDPLWKCCFASSAI